LKKIAFLDRDGVVNIERGEYTFEIKDFEFHPEIIAFLKELKKRDFQFILISNQGGIAKGLYSCEMVDDLHAHMQAVLVENGVPLLDQFYSPHHQDFGESLDRKPDSLMLERAIYRHNVKVSESFLVGDSERDIFAAAKVGVRGFKIEPNGSLLDILNHLDA